MQKTPYFCLDFIQNMESSPVIFIQEFEIKRGGNNPAMNDCLPPDFLPLFQAFGHIESMKELSDENVHTF